MKKLINGERYNQEIAMHAGYHLEITATETAYIVAAAVTAAYKSQLATICLCFHRAYPPFHLLISVCWLFSKKVSPGRKNFNFFLAVSTMLKIL